LRGPRVALGEHGEQLVLLLHLVGDVADEEAAVVEVAARGELVLFALERGQELGRVLEVRVDDILLVGHSGVIGGHRCVPFFALVFLLSLVFENEIQDYLLFFVSWLLWNLSILSILKEYQNFLVS